MRLLILLMVVLVWLGPFFWAGLGGALPAWAPSRLSHQYGGAGLFYPNRTGTWAQMLVQVQRKSAPGWKTIITTELSPMGAFGYRQRLDRILQEAHGKPMGNKVRHRLAEWVARRFEKVHPEEGGVVAVRFGAAVWAVNTPELASPSGHWVPNPAVGIPKVPFTVVSAFSISQGKARLLVAGNTMHQRPGGLRPPPAAVPPPAIGKRFRPVAPMLPRGHGSPSPASNASPAAPLPSGTSNTPSRTP